jgi:anti-sigma regulatory factor (Ser/Thr protein kinase)
VVVNKTLMVKRDLKELGRAADQIRTWLVDVLDEDGLACVELAFVEALTNSIRYGPTENPSLIGVFVEVSDTQVAVEIDDGSPPMPTLFDDAGAHKLDFDINDLENLPEGGRGLSLIVLSMDEVTFRPVDNQMRLRMVRHRT